MLFVDLFYIKILLGIFKHHSYLAKKMHPIRKTFNFLYHFIS